MSTKLRRQLLATLTITTAAVTLLGGCSRMPTAADDPPAEYCASGWQLIGGRWVCE